MNWWDNKDFGVLGDSSFEASWACSGMIQDALKDWSGSHAIVYDSNLDGVQRPATIDEVIKKFEDLGLRIVLRSPPWRGKKYDRIALVGRDAFVGLWADDGDLDSRVVTTNKGLFDAAQKILEEVIGTRASAGRVYALMMTESGPKLQSLGLASVPLERENYDPEVLADFDMVVADLKSDTPAGRVAIFDGEPGTGKTYMIRGLLSEVPDALFVLVPASLIPQLSSPSMISALLETRRDKGNVATIFVIEDADECLVRRQEGNVSAVSALLNLGDGILGSLMDLRLVCTTNLRNDELDDAVVRPGRLSCKIHVGPLSAEVANKLYKKLTGDVAKTPYHQSGHLPTLAEVYSAARMDGWKPVLRKSGIGFRSFGGDSPDYLPADGK